MKTKNRQFLAMSAVVALTLSIVTSCKKDKDENNASAQLSATVNGTAFKPNLAVAMSYGDIWITGYEAKSGGDSLTLSVNVPGDAALNTPISLRDDASLDYSNIKGTIEYGHYGKYHGSVTVTSHDKTGKKVAGTFNGVLYKPNSTTDSVVITDGKFNIGYTSF